MKGDAFREMAARCGDLPDSVMAVPGLEYVGENSAEWEALCVNAAAWCGEGPDRDNGSEPAEWALAMEFFRRNSLRRSTSMTAPEFAGLALFCRLMAIVMRGE